MGDEIPERHKNPDPNWENWPSLAARPFTDAKFLECPFCAATVHESSAPMHAKWHESLTDNLRSLHRGMINAFNA